MRIAFLHGQDLHHFLPGVEGVFRKAGHEVRRVCPRGVADLAEALRWGDVVWCEFANEVAAAASRRPHPNLIVRMHSYESFGHVAKVQWQNVRTLLYTAEHVLARALGNAPQMADVSRVLLPSAVDTERFALQQHGQGTRIGTVCYISGIKQPGMWTQLLAMLPKDYSLHVAGLESEADWVPYLRAQAELLGVADRLHFDGHVEDVAAWWADKDWCLSTSAREGCPYNVIEAMACGVRPVIHEYVGARAQFPEGYLWRTLDEAVEGITRGIVAPFVHRNTILDRYSLAAQEPALLALLDGVQERKPARPTEIVLPVGAKLDESAAQAEGGRAIPRASTNPLCSLAMIALVRNQDEMLLLEKAIASVDSVADEKIIVLDERSIPILPWSPNMRIIRRPWADSFSEARNAAAMYANGDWLLILDADDHFDDVGNLRQCMEVAPPECDVIVASVSNVDEAGQSRDESREVVAYRPHRNIHWERRGHNQLVGYDKWADSTAHVTSLYPRSRDVEKALRTLPLLLKDAEECHTDASTHYHLAKTYAALGKVVEAQKAARRAIDMDPTSIVHVGAWRVLAFTTLDVEGLDACEKVIEEAYRLHPKCPDVIHARAFVMVARWAEACQDPENIYLATIQGTPRYVPIFAQMGRDLGWPLGPAEQEPQAQAA